jgi:hypothetical protein
MTTLREAAQMALDALDSDNPDIQLRAATHLRAALAQPEQEPPCKTGSQCVGNKCEWCAVQEREWQGLTNQDYEAMAEKYVTNCYFDTLKYAHAIEAKLKEKNT